MTNVETVVIDGKKSERFQEYRRFTQLSVLSLILFNTKMDGAVRNMAEGQQNVQYMQVK
jgi:hypothetical protein